MTSTPHQQARKAVHLGCAAAAGYAVLKAAWALGSTVGVRADAATWDDFLAGFGGPMIALWGTVLLALFASAILQSLVRPWGRRVPWRLPASLAWLGFAIMTPLGLLSLGHTLSAALAGKPFPLLAPAIYTWVYGCFLVLGLAFAITAWRTRNPEEASFSPSRPRHSTRFAAPLTDRQENR
jgi:hypothetical protein